MEHERADVLSFLKEQLKLMGKKSNACSIRSVEVHAEGYAV